MEKGNISQFNFNNSLKYNKRWIICHQFMVKIVLTRSWQDLLWAKICHQDLNKMYCVFKIRRQDIGKINNDPKCAFVEIS